MINREFLKNAYRIGGLIAISILVVISILVAGMIKDARGWSGILPAIVGSGEEAASTVPVAYANWLEDSEATLDTTNIHCMMLENLAAGDETGTGVVAGVNLDWTMRNGVLANPGATPPYRQITRPDEGFVVTNTLLDTILTGAEWTILLKLENLLFASAGYITYIEDDNDAWWRIDQDSNGTISFYIDGIERNVGAHVNNVLIYVAVWKSGGVVRCGWTSAGSGANGQPTKWSDFNAANRFDDGATASPAAGTWDHETFFNATALASGITAKAYYVLLANISLIDNAA